MYGKLIGEELVKGVAILVLCAVFVSGCTGAAITYVVMEVS